VSERGGVSSQFSHHGCQMQEANLIPEVGSRWTEFSQEEAS
jgi:hypothetical protein